MTIRQAIALVAVSVSCVTFGRAEETAATGTGPGPSRSAVSGRSAPSATGVRGHLKDVASHRPIANAVVSYIGQGMAEPAAVVARPDGSFEITGMEPGPYVLTVTADGYRPRININVTVVAGAVSLAGVLLREALPMWVRVLRAGLLQVWAAPLLAMWVALWATRGVWTASEAPPLGTGARALVGAGVGLLVTIPLALALFGLTRPRPSVLDGLFTGSQFWAWNGAIGVVRGIAVLVGPLVGVVVSLTPRVLSDRRRSAMLAAIGGSAAAMAVACTPAASSGAGSLLRMLTMLELSAHGPALVTYVAVALLGGATVGALVGLSVSHAVASLCPRRASAPGRDDARAHDSA